MEVVFPLRWIPEGYKRVQIYPHNFHLSFRGKKLLQGKKTEHPTSQMMKSLLLQNSKRKPTIVLQAEHPFIHSLSFLSSLVVRNLSLSICLNCQAKEMQFSSSKILWKSHKKNNLSFLFIFAHHPPTNFSLWEQEGEFYSIAMLFAFFILLL